MNEHEMIRRAVAVSMPDIESVRLRCIRENGGARSAKRSSGVKYFVPAALCAAAVLCATYALNRGGPGADLSGQSGGVPSAQQNSGTPSGGGSSAAPADGSAIAVNELPALPSSQKMNIALKTDDFVRMNGQELCAFYGADVFPSAVPGDMKETADALLGIYRREGGTREIYYSQNVIRYSNAEFTRNLYVEVAAGGLPHTDVAVFSAESKKSSIGGTDVYIGRCESGGDGYYYAEFIFHNVGFRVTADGLSQEEFVGALSSIIR